MPGEERAARWRVPNGFAISSGLALTGLWFGLRPLFDNSFLTHLATGRLILDRGMVPTTDPYSYTAAGEPWVVQSWLPALVYGLVDRAAGGAGLLALQATLLVGLGVMVAALTSRLDSVLPRAAIGALALVVGGGFWSERPLVFGLLLFGATLLIAEREIDPRWLAPVFAIWVASHGSFPLGLVLLASLVLGSALDRRPVGHLFRCVVWASVGAVLGSLFPLGPELLLFPLSLLRGGEVLEGVVEWQAPSFEPLTQQAWLVQLLLAIVLVVRRPSYRVVCPLVVFGGASLLALRNIPIASLAILPGMAMGAEGIGTISDRARSAVASIAVMTAVALAAVSISQASARPAFDLGPYPVTMLATVRDLLGDDVKIIAEDSVGNYRTAVDGPDANVFYDDRFDMYSPELAADHRALVNAATSWESVLERNDADVVVWRRSRALSEFLTLSVGWQVIAADAEWISAVPR